MDLYNFTTADAILVGLTGFVLVMVMLCVTWLIVVVFSKVVNAIVPPPAPKQPPKPAAQPAKAAAPPAGDDTKA